jgi:glycosyltransferase involved in cell wall biosynthesis
VGAAVDSVLKQDFEDLELVVVDDGSSDDTAARVGDRDDSRVRCLRTDNQGVSRARNRGVHETTGEWIAFLDADDVWLPTKLSRQLEVLAHNRAAGLSFTSATVVDDELRRNGQLSAGPSSNYTRELLLLGNVIAAGGSSVLARRSMLDQTGGFDPSLSQCADWDMWLRLSLLTPFVPVSDPLVLYRRVAGTMSSNPSLLERDTFALLDKFYARIDSEPYRAIRKRVYANHWMICAGTYLHVGQTRDSVRCLVRGLSADPRTIARPLLLPARRLARRNASDRPSVA